MTYKLLSLLLCLSAINIGVAQHNTTSSGGFVSNSSTSLSFSIGDSFSNYTNNENYSINSGVIQTFSISETLNNGNDISFNFNLKAYPNPTKNFLVLSISERIPEKTEWKLFDIKGRLLDNQFINQKVSEIPMQSLSEGTYILHVLENNNQIKTFKIIKN